MKKLFLLLLISAGLFQQAYGQFKNFKQDSTSLSKAQWWAGVDAISPFFVQLDNYTDWKQAIEVEAFIEWRRGTKRWSPRIATTYFYGFNRFSDDYNRLALFLLKPGLTLNLESEEGTGIYFRASIPFSVAGNIETKTALYDIVYNQPYTYQGKTRVNVTGFELAYGYAFEVGKILLTPELVFITGRYDSIDRKQDDRASMYVGGIGSTSGFPFEDTGFTIKLFIGRAW